jgi:2,3-bisphosphoglycerate-dependent phosphoglycerate mutase
MTAPRKINLWLVRHALSAANLDKGVNHQLPDQEVPLAPEGPAQALQAGRVLAKLLAGGVSVDPTVRALTGARSLHGRTRVLCSPYERTRQTAVQIREALCEQHVDHDYREELALREISFGLFDGYDDDELAANFPMEYAHYQKHMLKPGSEFWAGMPMGESRAQVADRVKGALFGTILRDNDPERADPIVNFVIVSHGVTLRALVMQWMHHKFENWPTNPANASVQLITSCNQPGLPRYRHGFVHAGVPHTRNTVQDQREANGTA